MLVTVLLLAAVAALSLNIDSDSSYADWLPVLGSATVDSLTTVYSVGTNGYAEVSLATDVVHIDPFPGSTAPNPSGAHNWYHIYVQTYLAVDTCVRIGCTLSFDTLSWASAPIATAVFVE